MREEELRIALNAPVPHSRRHKTPILRPKPGGAAIVATIVNHYVAGLMVHWDGSKTQAHRPAPFKCQWCEGLQRPYWMGFLATHDNVRKRRAIVEVTRHMVAVCPHLDPLKGIDLRGRQIEVWRPGTKADGGVMASLAPQPVPTHVCPPEWSLARALEVLFDLPDGCLYFPDDGEDDPVETQRYSAPDPETEGL